PASAQDHRSGAADGRRLHHQRREAADRADDRAPRRGPGKRDYQGDAGRRLRARAAAHRSDRGSGRGAAQEETEGDGQGSQRPRMTMERIPILRMGNYLLVTIQVDMHDRLAMQLQEDLTTRIAKDQARGVLIDISALDIVDSFIGRMLADIAGMSRVLDAQTVLVGMQPAVAITLVELGLSLPGVRTALEVERGMKLLEQSIDDQTFATRAHEADGPGGESCRAAGPRRD